MMLPTSEPGHVVKKKERKDTKAKSPKVENKNMDIREENIRKKEKSCDSVFVEKLFIDYPVQPLKKKNSRKLNFPKIFVKIRVDKFSRIACFSNFRLDIFS